jgi:hypothetical protein
MAIPDATPSNGLPERFGCCRNIGRPGRGALGVLYRGVDPVLDREAPIDVSEAKLAELRRRSERTQGQF